MGEDFNGGKSIVLPEGFYKRRDADAVFSRQGEHLAHGDYFIAKNSRKRNINVMFRVSCSITFEFYLFLTMVCRLLK